MTARSLFAFALTAFCASAAAAQELAIPPANIPQLADFALDSDVFAPKGWTMESQTVGDLDKDGDEDVVFVLHEKNPANVLKNEGLGAPELDTNPRILGVGFREGTGYRLVLQNSVLIPRHIDPVLDDAFAADGGIEVARGAFSVVLNSFSSAGSWEAGNARLTFRWQNGRFELIGWERNTVQRNSGATVDTSANFSTGVLEIKKGSIENDRSKTAKKKIALKPMPIDQVGDGLDFGSGADGSPLIE
ncbi:hypothetical protein IZ6_28900 [Terrihabitans soli]|uniref:VCBS repeat-containing protein n=1 Tax=Terrihabitans soli TaxID=708113 RepID=A0A6S6QX76_9HYPH|nr:hypothetical protein [Terrihabitans soli]BCJ92155.1 hypothetical protein IZ6_28900 [Terrihabitans soli]